MIAMQREDGEPAAASSSSISPKLPPNNQQQNSEDRVYRRILRQSVAAICHSNGFHSAQSGSLDAMTAVAHKFLSSACASARAHCEHAGRTRVTPGDVHMALLNGGQPKLDNFGEFLRSLTKQRLRGAKQPLAQLELRPQSPPPGPPPLLRIADPRPHPSHFPNFLPPFPDPHTYIRTEIRDDVDSGYERVRRLNAKNRRDWEQSLVRYALGQLASVSVFRELEARLAFEAKDAIEKQRVERRQRWRQKLAGDKGSEQSPATVNGEQLPTPMEVEGDEEELPATEGGKATEGAATKATEKKNNGIGGSSSTAEDDAALFEELFDPVDTERSYVMKRIPHYCHILLPFEEARPYLSALLTADDPTEAGGAAGSGSATSGAGGGDDYFARILSKEMGEDEGGGEGGEQQQIIQEEQREN